MVSLSIGQFGNGFNLKNAAPIYIRNKVAQTTKERLSKNNFLDDQNNKIHFCTKEDLAEVVKIENRCHLTPWTNKNFIDSYDAKNLFKVLKNENDIIGYYIALFALDECELLNITVKSELQKKGFGELMLKDLFSECRKEILLISFLR